STIDALAYVKTQPEWAFVADEKKRQRVIREKYWRLVRQAAIFSNRTGVQLFLAVGRTEKVTRGLKEHVFASADVCNPANQCLHETAGTMAGEWSKAMKAYREVMIVQNKAKDDLLRQQQAQFLANQRLLKEKDESLAAALGKAAELQAQLDLLTGGGAPESVSRDPSSTTA
ncbi:hypothetical protein OC842_007418, partial [Tilletia horrida]